MRAECISKLREPWRTEKTKMMMTVMKMMMMMRRRRMRMNMKLMILLPKIVSPPE